MGKTETLNCCCGPEGAPPPGTGQIYNCPSFCGYYVDGLHPSHYLAVFTPESYDPAVTMGNHPDPACNCMGSHPFIDSFLLAKNPAGGVVCSQQWDYQFPSAVCGSTLSGQGPRLTLVPSGGSFQLRWRRIGFTGEIWNTWHYVFVSLPFTRPHGCSNIENRLTYDQTIVMRAAQGGFFNTDSVANCYPSFAATGIVTLYPIWF